jgi:hypothetical protein
MVDGQFIQIASVALHLHQGTVRETMVTVLYALDSLGMEAHGSERAGVDADDQRAVRRARATDARRTRIFAGGRAHHAESITLNREATAVDR